MNELKAEIQKEASRAAQLSKEAMGAFAARNFAVGKALMKEAHDAGSNCSRLIEQYTQTCKP